MPMLPRSSGAMKNSDSDISENTSSAKAKHRQAIDAFFAATTEELNATYREPDYSYEHCEMVVERHRKLMDALFAASEEELNATYRGPETHE